MKGLDTNVLVRYLVRDDRKQSEKASVYIQKAAASGKRCYINHVVLCELVWVLESAYKYSKKEIADVLDKILVTKQFEIDSKDVVSQSVHDYRNGNGDLSDYLIGRVNRANGCDTTVTFDLALRTSPYFAVLE
ncbi:MAG: type II toxin-antitoxin system VapC family toxin [Nitrospirae bacterium]|nr:type II toxin-antitoxin system VapC family toxin [Nitrospirota bacterium]